MSDPDVASELFACAAFGEVTSLQLLAQQQCPTTFFSLRDELGNTLLIEAAKQGHLDTSAYLLNSGADIDAVDAMSRSALHWACGGGHLLEVELLLRRGAHMRPDSTGATPLHFASRHGYERIVSILIEAGADPLLVTSSGGMALEWLSTFPRAATRSAVVEEVVEEAVAVPPLRSSEAAAAAPYHMDSMK